MTNKGIQIQLPLLQTDNPSEYLAALGCHEENDFMGSIGLFLHEVGTEENQYIRCRRDTKYLTFEETAKAKLRTIFVSKRDEVEEREHPIEKCWIRTQPRRSILHHNIQIATVIPKVSWNSTHNIINIRGWLVE
jgi:hypothetical protein